MQFVFAVQQAASSQQAFQEQCRPQTAAAKQESELAPWEDSRPELHNLSAAAADSKQSDDIFGPAHEFD